MLKNISIKELVDIGAKGSAFLVTSIYVIGFIAANSYLSQFGYFDYQLSNLRFLVVGGLCVTYFACWYLFAGRYIVHVKAILSAQIKRVVSTGGGPGWVIPFFIDSIFIESLFMMSLSCAFFAMTVMHVSSAELFTLPLILNYLVVYPLDVANVDLKYPRTFFFIQLVMKGLPIVGFAAMAVVNPGIIKLFASYLIMSVYLNMVLDTYERRSVTRDLVLFTGFFSAIVILTSVVWFGYSIYGDIRQKVGGGEPVAATIYLRGDSGNVLPEHLTGKIIYRNGSDTLINTDDSPIVVANQDISRVQFHRLDEPNIISNFVSTIEKLKSFFSFFRN